MSSPEPRYDARERLEILAVARRSIAHGVHEDRPLPVDPGVYPQNLRSLRATFVTLHRHGGLRGCVGSLEAKLPLVVDVAESAFRAGFRDPRFDPLRGHELDDLEIHVSILSPFERLVVASEAELLRYLRPGLDGLFLREGPAQATFLPAVWSSVPDARCFLRELKRKAGLPPDHWSPALETFRYTAESIP